MSFSLEFTFIELFLCIVNYAMCLTVQAKSLIRLDRIDVFEAGFCQTCLFDNFQGSLDTGEDDGVLNERALRGRDTDEPEDFEKGAH